MPSSNTASASTRSAFEDTDRIAREMYRDRMFDKFFGKYGTLKDYRKLVEDSRGGIVQPRRPPDR